MLALVLLGPKRLKTPPLTVGRGPVPRQCSRTPMLAGDRPPRYGQIRPNGPKTPPLTVGRGPVPRHRSRALQRSRGPVPRATGKLRPGGLSYRTHRNMKHSRFDTGEGQALALRDGGGVLKNNPFTIFLDIFWIFR